MTWQGHVRLICAGGLALFVAAAATPGWAQSPKRGTDAVPAGGQYILRSAAQGAYVYRAPGWSASIAPDGTVGFHEPAWVPRSRTVEIITGSGEGRKPEVWPVPIPTPTRPTEYDLREQDQDSLTPRLPAAEPIFVDVGFRSDITDDYTRLMGGDPYAPEKAAFMAGTFDFRMKLAAQQHHQAVRAALADLTRELQAIWNDPQFSPAERGHIIFLLWQETDTTSDGLRARQLIRDFARRNLPPAQAARFTASPIRE